MRRICIVLTLISLFALPAHARIKLITLPVRERVEVQLDHPDVTLIEEERIVPLVRGINQVDFAWANTAIDASTIVFRVLDGPGDVTVLSVSYPPNESALVWQVAATESGAARVRISYILGGLTRSFLYRAIAAHDESTLRLNQYIELENRANESFGESEVYLGYGDAIEKPIGIAETRRVLMEKFTDVPIRKTYTASLAEFGYIDQPKNKLRIPMHYVLTNDDAHGLGVAALPFGKVRIFQEDGRGSVAFLGEDWGQYTPLDDEMRLFLGVAQDVSVIRTIDRRDRTRVAGNLYNHDIVVKFEIENFKDEPITLDIAENLRQLRDQYVGNSGRPVQWTIGEQTTFAGGYDREKSSLDSVLYHVDLPARSGKIVHKLHVTFANEW